MWYFAWVLGVGFAVVLGVLNGLWHEFGLADDASAVVARTKPDFEAGRPR